MLVRIQKMLVTSTNFYLYTKNKKLSFAERVAFFVTIMSYELPRKTWLSLSFITIIHHS
ncbi:MAG: hypothetical protein RLZZ292_3309 [Bacteroidota bacterium]|jgi:hypothetical protein